MINDTSRHYSGLQLLLWLSLITSPVLADSTTATTAHATTSVETISLKEQLADVDYGEGGEMILEFYLRDILLSDALFAQVSESAVYLPFGEFVTLLDLPIVVDYEAGRASGWVFEPGNNFTLNIAKKSVSSFGKEFELNKKSIIDDDFDLYVNIEDLQTWFPFTLDFHLSSQILVLRSSEALPAELARQRMGRELSSETVFAATQPYSIPPYRLLDWPALNFNIGSSGGSRSATPNYDYSVVASGDLAFMNGQFSARGNDQEFQSARLTLGRANPSGMFGPLHLADYELGDTSQFLPGLIGNSLSGRGIRLGNTKLSAKRNFDILDLTGPLQPGHEVELYVNDRLIDVTRESSEGLYEFNDIPLRLGQNILRLEFYGPQGQRNTETTRYIVGSGQNRPGQFTYEFASLQPGRMLFENINDNAQARTTSVPANQLSSALDFSYGLTRRSTIGLTVAHLADSRQTEEASIEDTVRNNLTYIDAHLNTSVSGLYVSYNLAVDDQSSLASSLGARTRTKNQEYAFSFTQYDDEYMRYNDLQTTTIEELPKRQLSATVASNFSKLSSNAVVSWTTSGDYIQQRNGQDTASISARIDASAKRIGGSWVHRVSKKFENGHTNRSGSIGFVFRPGNNGTWSYRTGLDYLDPADSIVQDATFGAYRRLANNSSLALQISRSLEENTNRYSASWQQQLTHFGFTSTLAGTSKDDISFRIGTSFSVGRSPGKLLPAIRNGAELSSPRLGVLVFVDDNNNRVYDHNEEVVEGVPITRNGLLTDAITDEHGYATVSGLSQRSSVDISIVASGVRNPELRLAKDTEGVLPRPGRLPIIEIPLVRVRDLEGTVTIDGSTPAPNVTMILRPIDGGDPLEISTEFDGIYFLADVPLGEYELAPQSEQLQSLDLIASPTSLFIHVTKNDTLLSGINFNLIRKPPEATSVSTASKDLSSTNNTLDIVGRVDY